jgi:hypothetical protein
MLDDELSRRFKDAALDGQSDVNMQHVRKRARSLKWARRSMALGVAMVLIIAGGTVALTWPKQRITRFSGPGTHLLTNLPRGWSLNTNMHGIIARLTEKQAIAIATRGWNSKGNVVGAQFGLFTSPYPRVDSTPSWKDLPAWIVQLHGVPCSVEQPLGPDFAKLPKPCRAPLDLVVIDDRTGKVLQEYQQGPKPSLPQGPRLGLYHPNNTSNEVALNGTLVLHRGCVMVKNAPSELQMLAWPTGFTTQGNGTSARVINDRGRDVAAIGDRIHLGGGPIPARLIRTAGGQSLPSACVIDHAFAVDSVRVVTASAAAATERRKTHLVAVNTRLLREAAAKMQTKVDVPILLPTRLPKGSHLAPGKSVSFYRFGGHWDARLNLVFDSDKSLSIDYGVGLFDGCGADSAKRVSVRGQPGLILSDRSHTTTQLIWPATRKHPQGLYGLNASVTPSQALAIAESMRAVTNSSGGPPPGC